MPHMRIVRADPRFMPLAVRLGLADYWLDTDQWPDFCTTDKLPYDCKRRRSRRVRNATAPHLRIRASAMQVVSRGSCGSLLPFPPAVSLREVEMPEPSPGMAGGARIAQVACGFENAGC